MAILHCPTYPLLDIMFSVKRMPIKKTTYRTMPVRPRLSYKRGQLFTYRVFQSNYLYPSRGNIIIDCGFNIFKEVPPRAGARYRKGDIVRVVKYRTGIRVKKLNATKQVLYTYKAYIEKIVDGDTVWVYIDCGLGDWVREKLRLRGLDAPEIATKKGKEARKFLDKKLRARHFIIIKTYGTDIYNRYLVDIFYKAGETNPHVVARDGTFLNQELLDAKLAVPM